MVKKVGPYSLESKLGEGSYGTVYFGHDSQTNLPIAAKAISLENLKSRFLEQLESEISAMKRLDSPYIVKLYDVLKTSRNVYMIMEYCSGGDLDHYIKKTGPTPEHLARKWLSQVLEAFHCLRSFKIIHRDLKLANILLSHEDPERADVKLADFGFAKILNEVSKARTMLGTPLFMAPEIFNKEEYAFSVDIWSLGVLAYEVLVGVCPFQCKNIEELKVAQRAGVNFPADCSISEAGKDLVRRMLAYNPADRPSLEDLQAHAFFTGSPAVMLLRSSSVVEAQGSQSPELFTSEMAPETPTFLSDGDQASYSMPDFQSLENALSSTKALEHLIDRFIIPSPTIAEFLTLRLTTELDALSKRIESVPHNRTAMELHERLRIKRGKVKKWIQTLEERKAHSSPDLSATTELLSENEIEREAQRLWRSVKQSPDPYERSEIAQGLSQLLVIIGAKGELAGELGEAVSPTLTH